MAVAIGAKPSTEAVNDLGVGSDNGLYCGGTSPRGGAYNCTMDNAVTPTEMGRTFYYTVPVSGFSTFSWTANTALFSPLMLSHAARVTELYSSVTTAGAGSQMNVSIYATNPTTGNVSGKLVDLARFDTTATGLRSATILAPTYVLGAATLYWVCSWVSTTSAYPTVSTRVGPVAHGPFRVNAQPFNVNWFGGSAWGSLVETTATWSTLTSAPASVSPAYPNMNNVVTTAANSAFYYWWGLYNV